MNELQLPPAPPLPAEVRERVLRTVLAGAGAPRRRLAPLVAAAVAVVATLTVTTSVAVIGTGADRPAAQQAPPGPSAPPDGAAVEEALRRCAAAVAGSEAREEYPPPAEWRVTDVLPLFGDPELLGDEPGSALAIDDSFACHAGRYHVTLTSVGGAPAGAVQVARLTGTDLVLFNPQRVEVEVDPGDGITRRSTAVVQAVHTGPSATAGPARRLIVPGSYDGPLPDPGDIAIAVQDRPIPEPPPLPDPPPDTPPPTDEILEHCLYEQLRIMERSGREPRETVLHRQAQGDTPRALVGLVDGTWVAVCYDDPGGPVAVGGGLAPARMAESRIVASLRRDGLVTMLMTVAPDVERVEISTVARPGAFGTGALCTREDGVALCMLRTDDEVEVRAFRRGGTGTVLPVP